MSAKSTADQTAAIQAAINSLKTGQTLVFPAGTYMTSHELTITVAGVNLYGTGATIHSTNPTRGAIMIEADDVAVYGFTTMQDTTSRQTTPWSSGIVVYKYVNGTEPVIHGAIIQGNHIIGAGAAGIFLANAEHFTIASNTVYRNLADGIHMTSGSANGRVINNSVSENGDDMIAVVSYSWGSQPLKTASAMYSNWTALQKALDNNILIAGNSVGGQYWGRGITVVGGSNVTIDNNTVNNTPMGAGMYITREVIQGTGGWLTFGDHNVLIENNTIENVQDEAPPYDPFNRYNSSVITHQGAIEISSYKMLASEAANATYKAAFSVDQITVQNNTIKNAAFAGFRIGLGYTGTASVGSGTEAITPGPTTNIVLNNNAVANVGVSSLVQAGTGLVSSAIACTANSLNSSEGAACAGGVGTSTVTQKIATGANLSCSSDGVY